MTVITFIEAFAEQFDDTEFAEFKPELRFRDLEEWDSLSALSVIAMIDEKYEVQLSGDELRSVSTLQELFDLVESKK